MSVPSGPYSWPIGAATVGSVGSVGSVGGVGGVGIGPNGVAFDGTNIWVTNRDSDNVSKLVPF